MGRFRVEGLLTPEEKERHIKDLTRMKMQLGGEIRKINKTISSLTKEKNEKQQRHQMIANMLIAVQEAETTC
jgi:hypothetical protein